MNYYETMPVSRLDIREFSKLFRSIIKVGPDDPVDCVALLDRLPDFEGFGNVRYEVLDDSELRWNVPAQCVIDESGYTIQIKECVLKGASEKGIGGYRMHIMHEIMHVFVDKLGLKPIYPRALTSRPPCYRNLEWIVKALAGEVMMPYEATKNMSVEQIMQTYGVSKEAALKRKRY